MSWSPIGNQPRSIFTIDGSVDPSGLIQMEYRVPGCMVYGRKAHDRKWYRLERSIDDLPFDYYTIHAHGSCSYLIAAQLDVSHAVQHYDLDKMGELSGDTPAELDWQAEQGRKLAKNLLDEGIIKDVTFQQLAHYQLRTMYYAWLGVPGLKIIMPCGSGKTLAAIASSSGTTLVVCPARARRGWEDQVDRWTNIKVQRLLPGMETSDIDTDCRFFIVGLELLADYLNIIEHTIRPTLIIYDEIHRFANHQRWTPIYDTDGSVDFQPKQTASSKTNRAVRGYAAMKVSQLRTVTQRFGLTASPMGSGHRSALWAEDDLLMPRSLGQFRKFAIRYCSAREGEYGFEHRGHDEKTPEHVIQELRDRQSQYVQEVTHSESHGGLPETRTDVVYIEQALLNKTPWGGYDVRRAKSRWKKERSVDSEEALLLKQTARDSSLKRDWIKQKVMEGLENGGKVVVLTFLRSDAERWADYLKSAIRKARLDVFVQWGHGGTSERMREGMAPAFAEHDGAALLVGTGGAFGESVDGLQHANLALIVQLPWTPMDVDQWRGRFDRLGGRATLLLIPIAEGTHDELLVALVAPKFGGVRKMFEVEQYAGMKEKLLGIDTEENRDKIRREAIASMFGG